jgi:hypothetical protein
MLWVSPWWLFAQTGKPPSLKEQLEEQFTAETVLVIQKVGVLGVALASKPCAAKYQDGKLSPPDASCTAPLKNSSRPLAVGQKVNRGKIDVDLAKERISFQIVECGSCNKGSESSPYKSQIDFQFGKGYLEKASVSQIEDTISEVLAFDGSAGQQTQQAPDSQVAPGQQGEAHDEVLTNSDVVKMAKAKLGDGIIISKIKTSACNFDTSVDALVKLKEAGVSDPVIQAMHDAQEASKAAPSNETPGNEQAPAVTPSAGSYVAALHAGNPALVFGVESGRNVGNPALVFGVESGMTFTVDLVDHDGERALRLRVLHSHLSLCAGYLYVSHNRIAYDPVDTPSSQKDAFNLKRGDIKKAAATKFKFGSHPTVGILTEKKNYFFLLLTDVAPGVDFRQSYTIGAENVYDFIGRSLNDFDSVLHEAETLTANLTRRP